MGDPAVKDHNLRPGYFSYKPNQQYKVVHMCEGFLGVALLGQSSINPKKLETVLNKYSSAGYYVASIFTEKRRKFIFWSVEAAVVIFAKDRK